MRALTWYIFQFSSAVVPGWDNQTFESLCDAVKAMTPRGYQPAINVKAHAGSKWEAAFDSHRLAITGPDVLSLYAGIAADRGLWLGTWGEARGDPPYGGDLAGQAANAAGYYCLDLEPYSDFGYRSLPNFTSPQIREQAQTFWVAYQQFAPPISECGVSLVPLPSGVTPFGAGLRDWLAPVQYIEPQCYTPDNADLAPGLSVPWLRNYLRKQGVKPRRIVPILSRKDDWQGELKRKRWRYGVSLWRL